MDAGARGRRLLQRREYRAKVSEFIPKELEDQFSHDKNGQLVFELDLKKAAQRVKTGLKNWWNRPIIKDTPTQKQYQDAVKGGNSTDFQSYEPEGEMIEANSAQMKAMHDAQLKKKEDDKVASKKKDVKEGTKYGLYKGSGKASGAMKDYLDKKKKEKKKVDEACWKGYEKKGMKTMFGKRYPNCVKKTKKEEVQLEAKVDKLLSDKQKRERRNKAAGMKDKKFNSLSKDQVSKQHQEFRRDYIHSEKRGVKKVKGEMTLKDRVGKMRGVNWRKKFAKNWVKKEEVQLEAKKSCGEGEYYCYDDQKCKSIPEGMKVGKDGMLVKEDMKGMSQKSGDKRSTESGAGMTAQGVAKYNRRTGGNLKTAVTTPPSKLKPGSKAAKRRKSFCARSKSWTGPRGKAARRRWNCSYEPELPMIIDEKKKLFNTAPLSNRVSNWSKNIKEASPLTPGRNDFGLPTGIKTGSSKKNIEKKVNPKNLPIATASYEPKGEQMVQEMPDDIKGAIMTNLRGGAGDFSKGGNIKDIIKNRLKSTAKDVINTDTVKKTLNMGEMARKGKGAINSDVLKNNPNLDPLKPGDYIKLKRLSAKLDKASYEPQGEMVERKMTSAEKDKKEKYVKGMKKVKGDFTKRYGKDGKSVMYATATKMAMKKEGYGDVPFRDGRVKDYLGRDNIKNIQLTQKGKQAFKRIPDPKIFSGNKLINPDNPITQMYRSMDKVNSSYEPEGEMTEDFYRKKYTVKDGYKKTNKMTKSNKRSGDSKAQYRELHKDLAKYKIKKLKTEGSLHSWFKGSKSKDGKPGWVNVVTGGTCASDKPGEGTPKCVSSSKRASMTKAERLSASRRKKKADPGQQSKSGAAKPTYVATDSKKKK